MLLITLGLNIGAAAAKLAAGWASGSLSLLAGGVDSVLDGGANIVGLVVARAASHPPDEAHPYGHRKYETIVAVVIAFLLFLTCARLAWGAIQRLLGQAPALEVDTAVLLAPAVAFIFNIVASTYEGRRGRALRSELLVADASHTRADAGVSLALIGGLLAVRAGYAIVDPLLALAIAAVIAWTGWQIARETFDVLADARVLDPDEVARLARMVPGVIGAHKIRSRGPGDAVAVDLHVQVDPSLGVDRSHEIGHEVQGRLLDDLPGVVDVVVHVEPEWSLVEGEIVAAARRAVGRFPVEAHEIYVHEGPRVELGLHLELDPDLSLSEAHALASEIEAAVRAEAPTVDRVVTHLEPRTGGREPAGAAGGRDYSALVVDETEQVAGLVDAHDIEVVRVASGVRLSAHVRTVGELPLSEVHALAEKLEVRLRAAAPELERVTIHVEPMA